MPVVLALRPLVPGLLLVAAATAVAYTVNAFVPLLSALLVAIILGVLLRNVGLIRPAADPGVAFAGKKVLRAGVVLLGFQLSIPVILDLGLGVIGVIVAAVTLTYLGTLAAGRALGLSRDQRYLVATGVSICGASAVAAMAAVLQPVRAQGEDGTGGSDAAAALRARETEVDEAAATAVATVTLYGTLGLILVPLLAGPLGLDLHQAGVWAGSSIHEVGQVVAAGGLLGPDALDTAVVTKLGRVLLLAPMMVAVGLVLARQARAAVLTRSADGTGDATVATSTKRPPIMPLFVAGFLVAVVLRSVLGLPDAHPLPSTVKIVATLLLTAAMVGMGAGVNVRTLVRRGGPMLLLAGIASLLIAVVGYAGTMLLV